MSMNQEFFSPAVWTALAIALGAGMATVLGGVLVVFFKANNTRLLSFGLAFSGGAMVYVSLVEIFAKAQISFAAALEPQAAYAAATIFFFVGVGLLFAIDRFIPNPHNGMSEEDVRAAARELALGDLSNLARNELEDAANRKLVARVGLLAALAITAHNLPEGLATFFATLDNPTVGLALAVAIAVHNVPEGVSIAVPVYYATGSRGKAVLATLVSGLAEPLGAIIGYVLLAGVLTPFVFGAVFAVIAGAMVFLALDELLPAARTYSKGHETVYGMLVGMAVIALSLVLFK
jgi:ZIP family zinc transporter